LVVLTAIYSIVFTLILSVTNLKAILVKWGEEIQISVFMDEDLSDDSISKVGSLIQKMNISDRVGFSTKEDAKKRFLDSMPGFSRDVIEDPEFSNPFPASFQIGGLSAAQLASMDTIVEKLKSIPGVEDVSYGQEWTKNYAAFVQSLAKSGLFVLLTLLVGSFFVISHTVQVALAQRRDEIQILELVGASQNAIRAPYIFEGFAHGLISSSLAVLVSYLFFDVQSNLAGQEAGFLGIHQLLSFFSPAAVGFLLGTGALGGAMAAFLSVRKFNTGWSASGENF
jgi:cell division transport system permease protein